MDNYGIGIIEGQPIGEEFIRKRPKHIKGPLYINDKMFMVASGSTKYYGCPYGTFILNSQSIGTTIARLYRRLGINPQEKGFETVWNVGLPGNITSVGYDFPVRRKRGSIQIHCDPLMKSMGCIVLNKEDFLGLGHEIAEQKEELAIEILPSEDGAQFKIFPRPHIFPAFLT